MGCEGGGLIPGGAGADWYARGRWGGRQSRCIGVAQRMGRHVAPDAGRNDRGGEGIRYQARVEWCVTASIGEQPAGVVMAPPEVAQLGEDGLWQRHQPLLVALADDAQHLVGPVNGANPQASPHFGCSVALK